jgi:predicted MFS family arabinose efflux permease
LIFILSTPLIYLFPTVATFTIVIMLVTLASVLFDPAMRTHIGDVVPYEQRGMAVGITELSWAGALLVGAPIVALLISRFGWRSPFLAVAVGCAIMMIVIWRVIPDLRPQTAGGFSLRLMARHVAETPMLWAAAAYVGVAMMANMLVFSSYADWLERSFGLNVGGLGTAAIVLGSSELIGELSAGWLSDKFGKRRIVLITVTLSAVAYFLLPLVSISTLSALVGIFFVFLTFEMSFISVVPIFTELVPAARSVPLAVLSLTPPIARAIALLCAPTIAQAGGFQLICWTAAGLALLGAFVFRLVQEEPRASLTLEG